MAFIVLAKAERADNVNNYKSIIPLNNEINTLNISCGNITIHVSKGGDYPGPVLNASIMIFYHTNGTIINQSFTDINGECYFKNISAPDLYNITACYQGRYINKTTPLSIGNTTEIYFYFGYGTFIVEGWLSTRAGQSIINGQVSIYYLSNGTLVISRNNYNETFSNIPTPDNYTVQMDPGYPIQSKIAFLNINETHDIIFSWVADETPELPSSILSIVCLIIICLVAISKLKNED